MSHIKHNTTRKSRKLRILVIGCLFLCLFALLDILTPTASAAVKTGLTHKSNPSRVLKANLADLSGNQSVILDWRTQSNEITFNLPAHDWYENLDVFISATPEGNVSSRTPILLSFNGSAPIALNGRGSRFDAHIRLDTSRVRASGNTLTLTYQTPSDVNCLMKQHGKWIIDLQRSKLVTRTRAKQRNMSIAEIEPLLAHAMTTPGHVAILAKGSQKFALEAILAQGVAQRTHALPDFQFDSTRSDFTIIIGTNNQIKAQVKNKNLLNATSPSLFVDSGIKPTLILSAPNEDQVMLLARAFAAYHLPSKNRPDASIFDLLAGHKLTPRAILSAKSHQFSDIGDVSFSPEWRPQPAKLVFNVDNALTSEAILTLKLASGLGTNPQSRLNVSLNGQSLGYTKLDKKSKSVAFNIEAGQLQPSGNTLEFSPKLIINGQENMCASQNNLPSFMVSTQSKLRIYSKEKIPLTDLSHLAANGSMFSADKGDTALVLTARSNRDRAATLYFLGFAARQFGSQWVDAKYSTSLPSPADLNKNILIIGPNTNFDAKIMAAAPKAVKFAMGGKGSQGQNLQTTSRTERHASRNEMQAFRSAARTTGVPARINAGGVASIFPSPYSNGKLIGIISSTRPSYFGPAMKALSTESYWNALEGSVSRWDKTAIIMAQTSTPLPDTFFPQQKKTSLQARFENTKERLGSWFANINLRQPKQAQNTLAKPNIDQHRLRGLANPIPTPRVKPENQPSTQSTSLNASSVTIPKFANVKAVMAQKYSNAKTMFSNRARGQDIAQSAIHWLGGLKNNRLAILLFVILAGFFLMARTSPKEAGT